MDKKQVWLARMQRKLRWGLFVKWAIKFLAVGLFSCGLLILLLKLVAPGWWPYTLWLLALNIPLFGLAWIRSHREVYSSQDALAMLDSRIGAGGLLMSIDEMPDTFWESRLPELEQTWRMAIPRFRWLRMLKIEAAPTAFLLAACLIPERTIEQLIPPQLEVAENEIEGLRETLSKLEEQQWISQEDEEELADEIQKLADETRRQNLTHETWETVDALQQRMQQIVGSQRMQVSKAQGALATLQDAIDSGKPLSADRLSEIEAQLEDALKKNGLSNPVAKQTLERIMKNMREGKFNTAQQQKDLQQALEDLRDFMEGERQSLEHMMGEMEGAGRFEGEFDWEEREGDGGDGEGEPGQGGLGRGRGDADMGYGDESEEQGIKFKDTLLPEGVIDPNDDVIRVSLTEPDEEPVAPEGRAEARSTEKATGKNTWKRQLRPRHREVIRKYFDK